MLRSGDRHVHPATRRQIVPEMRTSAIGQSDRPKLKTLCFMDHHEALPRSRANRIACPSLGMEKRAGIIAGSWSQAGKQVKLISSQDLPTVDAMSTVQDLTEATKPLHQRGIRVKLIAESREGNDLLL